MTPNPTHRWFSAGAIAVAALASACCWLPLLLVALGVSSAGAAAHFAAWRPVFLVGAAALLAAGFYFVYLRKPACEPGEACHAPNPRARRRNRIMFWLAILCVGALALFPEYLPAITPEPVLSATDAASSKTVYTVTGMTCSACATHTRAALQAIPGVRSAEVSFDDRQATVSWISGPHDDEVIRALAEIGYEAERSR